MMFDGASLTAAEATAVSAYLGHKYAITLP
jgi:hypothetical protein